MAESTWGVSLRIFLLKVSSFLICLLLDPMFVVTPSACQTPPSLFGLANFNILLAFVGFQLKLATWAQNQHLEL